MASMSKPPKHCMFCGQTGQMTKEHAWPQWLGAGIRVAPIQSTRTIGFGRVAGDVMREKPNLLVHKSGSVLTARVREVCASCNNGWMSRLETEVVPLLDRLWMPAYPFGRTSLNEKQAATVATWATKTAWVRELVDQPGLTSTPEMRLQLMQTLHPPEFTSVWFARHQGLSNFAAYVAQIDAARADEPWDTTNVRRVLICTMAFRGLAITVRTDSDWGVPQMELPQLIWTRFWPTDGSVQWPPPQPAGDADVRTPAAHHTRWLNLPAGQFERNHEGWQVRRRN